jgi:hypothetical protein
MQAVIAMPEMTSPGWNERSTELLVQPPLTYSADFSDGLTGHFM